MKKIFLTALFCASVAFGGDKIDHNLSIVQIEKQYSAIYIGELTATFFYGKEPLWMFVRKDDTLAMHSFSFSVPQHPDDKQVCAAIISAYTEASVIEKVFHLDKKTEINI